jgi:hypothetical protein
MKNSIKYTFAATAIAILAACGGGSDSPQLYSCSGMIMPYSSLVTSTCVPIQSSPATSTAGMCCTKRNYSYDQFSQRYTDLGTTYSRVGENSCTASAATTKCP